MAQEPHINFPIFSIRLRCITLFVIIFLIVDKKYLLLIQSFLLILVFNIFYFFTLKDSTWVDWIQAISKRSKGLTGDLTQSSLLSLLHNNLILPDSIESIIYLASVLVILFFTIRSWPNMAKNYQFVTVLSLGPIISPYSHEQDFILSIFVFVIIVVRFREFLKNQLLLLGVFSLFLNLSKPDLAKSAFVISCFLLILYFTGQAISALEYFIITATVLFLQALPILLVEYLGDTRVSQIPKVACLILGYLCWYTTIHFARKSDQISTL